MAMTEDLAAFFAVDDFAEGVTVGGSAVTAIFDVQTQVVLGEVLSLAPTLLMPATTAPAAADGTVCVVRGLNYKVRQVLLEPPDGALKRLVLVRT
jgi:hypothetical protein